MAKTTKEKILEAALDVFAEKGFEAANIREIAEKVGIKTPSLYKHYSGKQEIYDSLLVFMHERLQDSGMTHDMDADEEIFSEKTITRQVERAAKLLEASDTSMPQNKLKRLMNIEQGSAGENFGCEESEELAYYEKLFGRLVESGVYESENLKLMALEYYSPIKVLAEICCHDADHKNEAVALLEDHIFRFCKRYRAKDDGDKKSKKKSKKKK